MVFNAPQVRVLWDYVATEQGVLSLRSGEVRRFLLGA